MLDCRADCVCCGNSLILCRYFRFSHNSLQMALLPQTISFKSIERAIIQDREKDIEIIFVESETQCIRHEENARFQDFWFLCV